MKELVIEIVKSLILKTKQKKAVWQIIEDGFMITLNGESYLTLQLYFGNHEEEKVIVLTIYNNRGLKIFSESTHGHYFEFEEFLTIQELYDLAYESIHKIEQTLNNLLNQIQTDPDKIIGKSDFDPDDILPF